MKRNVTDDLNELFIVVDKKDNIIGFRTRYECHHNKSLIHRAVGVVVFDNKGRILLQKRSLTKDLQPGYWGISAAGHVSKGETYEQAVKRELMEELGVDVLVEHVNTRSFEDERESEMHALYRVLYEGPFRTSPEEIDHVEFFGKEELAEKIKSGHVKLSAWAIATLQHISFLP
ncbi:NUDIX domain-containing protein [Candidatus Gottesmanbacteria bacterium]|nr:NUDIX domain-containing protein [Candidatus Gottesmanbacteria bacterium]